MIGTSMGRRLWFSIGGDIPGLINRNFMLSPPRYCFAALAA